MAPGSPRTRAMPSPVSSTRPTSSRSVSGSKASTCLRSASAMAWGSMVSSATSHLAHPLSGQLQPPPDGAVDHLVAHPGHHPADHRRVDDHLHLDVLPGGPGQGLGVVPGLLGTLQVAADLLGPGPHGLVEAGERVPGQHPEHDDERQAPEDQLARLRQDGVVLFLLGLGGLPLGDHRAEHCVVHRSPYRMKARTNPISARASVKAIPRNIVVRTMPAASGWRAMASMARPTTSPMPIPGPMAARP